MNIVEYVRKKNIDRIEKAFKDYIDSMLKDPARELTYVAEDTRMEFIRSNILGANIKVNQTLERYREKIIIHGEINADNAREYKYWFCGFRYNYAQKVILDTEHLFYVWLDDECATIHQYETAVGITYTKEQKCEDILVAEPEQTFEDALAVLL